MLQADRAMAQRAGRFARDLEIAVRHGDGGFFMHAGDEFGLLVAAVIDDGFVDAAAGGGRVAEHEIDVERLQHIDHEVRSGGTAQRAWTGIDLARHFGFGRGGGGTPDESRGWLLRRGLRTRRHAAGDGGGRAGNGCARQEFAAVHAACLYVP